MKITYNKINNLENIVEDASSCIAQNTSSYNVILAYEFNVNNLASELSDVTEEAKMWAAKECPKELHINHGSYIKDGMEHIINELSDKPSSNRALFSLISQKDISLSNDDPIPSFMIFQTCIESDILYCTAYFRALEVSTFLRINIEEVRIKLNEIHQKLLNFRTVRLVIFAFRGYNNPRINTLRKAKLDFMSPIQIYKNLETNSTEFYSLIKEKAKESTVIDLDPLVSMQEALNEIDPKKLQINIEYVKELIKKSIEYGESLKTVRTRHSHHESVDQIKEKFIDSLEQLASEFQ